MKKVKIIIILLLTIHTLQAQKTVVNPFAAIDKKALQLPDSLTGSTESISGYVTTNFKSEKDKARAIFTWVAANITYDIDNMYAINFYEPKENKILKPLKTRKGICENYAALFNDICLKSGIKSFVIEGYTKQNGFTDYIPHAWCAAQIDTSWFIFDPTWGSGYINKGKFISKINNEYFNASPSVTIISHMPFDYLWQFLNYPVTNQEFYEGKTQQNKSKPYFNFNDSIQLFEKQNRIEQLMSSAYRIEKNGVKNSLIFDRLQHIKIEIENDKQARRVELENERQTKTVNLYNLSVIDYNEGINAYNEFIQYRNKQFIPAKSDPEIQSMIDAAARKLTNAKMKLSDIENPDENLSTILLQLSKSIDEAATLVAEQQVWLKVYFSKGKSGRKSMFYDKKYTWFGIPLN